MALQSPAGAAPVSSFPIFSPKPVPPNLRPPFEIRFARWNNANARDLVHRQRQQKDIEDDIRRERRFRSAIAIAEDDLPRPSLSDAAASSSVGLGNRTPPRQDFKSIGTPSAPSRSSIPGRASKYSKSPSRNPKNPRPSSNSHPAFRRVLRVSNPATVESEISVGDTGVSYRVPNAPFEFQYSYTETPKVKPLALREPPVTPFGPVTMPRPWTGRKPLPGSKKQLPEFDSFRLPPPNKKGVTPVQAPGPFLAGSGPKYAVSREEILGEPLTEEEVKDLIRGCLKTRRQLNMGRDGFTHNMLENIHALWKRRRVCKIKCKGVCTVDMDNVRQQLEEKTGGKVIYSRGGVIFLFRGRNYNYRTRPKFPLMLWKPVTPVYPRLIQRVPEGLTLEEATEMRSRGRKLPPICKLGKNGVYCNLVNNVREAFEECDLVRMNCQGMNDSDYKKIGAKLKDLVPCILISFEHEHILVWRGREWKFSLPKAEDTYNNSSDCPVDSAAPSLFENLDNLLECQETLDTDVMSSSVVDGAIKMFQPDVGIYNEDVILEYEEDLPHIGRDNQLLEATQGEPSGVTQTDDHRRLDTVSVVSDTLAGECVHRSTQVNKACTESVLLLLMQAVESGCALVLENDDFMDADVVYKSSVDLAKTAPPGPTFGHRIRKVLHQRSEERERHTEGTDLGLQVTLVNPSTGERKHSARRYRKGDLSGLSANVVPNGSLGVDELAKLLA